MQKSLGILEPEDVAPAVMQVGDTIRDALGVEMYTLFFHDAGLQEPSDFLGRRLQRLQQILDLAETWVLRKEWLAQALK
jgi:hypothetical protein